MPIIDPDKMEARGIVDPDAQKVIDPDAAGAAIGTPKYSTQATPEVPQPAYMGGVPGGTGVPLRPEPTLQAPKPLPPQPTGTIRQAGPVSDFLRQVLTRAGVTTPGAPGLAPASQLPFAALNLPFAATGVAAKEATGGVEPIEGLSPSKYAEFMASAALPIGGAFEKANRIAELTAEGLASKAMPAAASNPEEVLRGMGMEYIGKTPTKIGVMHWYNDPATGSTLLQPEHEITEAGVTAHVNESRAKFGVDPLPTEAEVPARIPPIRPDLPPDTKEAMTNPQALLEGQQAGPSGRSTFQAIHDALWNDPIPNIHRASEDAFRNAVAHAGSRNAVKYTAKDMMATIFPEEYNKNTPISIMGQDYPNLREAFSDLMNKNDILGGVDSIAADGREAENGTPYLNAINKIAEKHDLNAYDMQLRAAMQEPRIMQAVRNYKQFVQTQMDTMYAKMLNQDPYSYLEGRGRYFGTRVNLVTKERVAALDEFLNEQSGAIPSPSSTSYRNPNVKQDPMMRAAKFTGDYSTDLEKNLQYVLSYRMPETTKIDFYKSLVQSGQATLTPGKGLQPLAFPFPTTTQEGNTVWKETRIYTTPELVKEIRGVLGTDMPLGQNPIAQKLTALNLASLSDATVHLKNMQSVLTRLPGFHESVMRDVLHRMPILGNLESSYSLGRVYAEIASDSPAMRNELSIMAQQGLIRAHYPVEGLLKPGAELIYHVDTSARVIANRAFNNLVARGWAQNTFANRYRFVTQLGEYNTRLLGSFTRAAKQSGMAPFIVAGRNYNTQGIRALTLNPSVTAAGIGAALKMRAMNAAGLSAYMTIPALINYATTGSMSGRPGTPIGSVDLGLPADASGKFKTWDILNIAGYTRGARITGVKSIVEGVRNQNDISEILDQGVNSMMMGAIHPWAGPVARVGYETLTGKQLGLYKMEARQVPTGSQTLENFRAALESTNPTIYSVIHPLLEAAGMATHPPVEEKSFLERGLIQPFARMAGVQDSYSPAQAEVRKSIAQMNQLRKDTISGLRGATTNEERQYYINRLQTISKELAERIQKAAPRMQEERNANKNR